jgi:antitoxin PrlF
LGEREGTVESVVSSKGQVVIPAAIRKRLGIVAGTHVEFVEVNGQLVMHKAMTDDPVARAFGCVPVRPGQPATTDALMTEMRDRPL